MSSTNLIDTVLFWARIHPRRPAIIQPDMIVTYDAVASAIESVAERIAELNPAGEKFDPHKHQAISALPSDKEPNTVLNVLQKGYALNDRVIRPALVTVAKAKDA